MSIEEIIELIEYLAIVLSLGCVWLNIRKNIWAWPVGIVGVVSYSIVFYHQKLYSDLGLQGFYLASSIYGWWQWATVKAADANDIHPIQRLSPKEWLGLIIAVEISALGLGAIMGGFTDANVPYLDAHVAAVGMAAQLLMTRKIIETWFLWILSDILLAYVFWKSGLPASMALYLFFTGMAVWGYREWNAGAKSID